MSGQICLSQSGTHDLSANLFVSLIVGVKKFFKYLRRVQTLCEDTLFLSERHELIVIYSEERHVISLILDSTSALLSSEEINFTLNYKKQA